MLSRIQNPPQSPVAYVVGPPLFPDIELEPGEKLLSRTARGLMEGIHSQYMYWNISGGPVPTVMHMEDGDLLSINIVRSGDYKILLVISPEDNELFEKRMVAEFDGRAKISDCSQAIRHFSVAVPPSLLDAWGIRYSINYFGPGTGFFTLERAYHAAFNMGNNFALAINHEDRYSPEMPRNYKFCNSRCAQNPITRAHWQPVTTENKASKHKTRQETRPPKDQPPSSLNKKRPYDKTTKPELEVADEDVGEKRKQAPPQVNNADLIRDITSLEALRRFCTLVSAWRELDSPPKAKLRASGDRSAMLNKWSTLSDAFSRGIGLHKLLSALTSIELARTLDAKNAKSDRAVSHPDDIEVVLKAREWEPTPGNRKKLTQELRVPRKMIQFFGSYIGLLCFTDFEITPATRFRNTPDETGELFQSSINSDLMYLNKIGTSFQNCILKGHEPPKCPFENLSRDQLRKSTAKDLRAFLAPFEEYDVSFSI